MAKRRAVLMAVTVSACAWLAHATWIAFCSPMQRDAGRRAENRPGTARLHLQGVCYSAILNESTLMTLKAERLAVRNKKVGVWRFGWGQEAVLDNAAITVFRNTGTIREDGAAAAMLPLAGLKELAGCGVAQIAPLVLTVHSDGAEPVQLTAARAEVTDKWRKLSLGGGVVARLGQLRFEFDGLTINLADGSVTCEPSDGRKHTAQDPDRLVSALAAALR